MKTAWGHMHSMHICSTPSAQPPALERLTICCLTIICHKYSLSEVKTHEPYLHRILNLQDSSETLVSQTLSNTRMQIKFYALCLNSFAATTAYAARPKFILVCWMQNVTWETRCILSPLLDFSVSGYFWPVPDTGNWPVQLKHLQMTLSLALIHTPIPPSLSPIKYISPFIGSFLSLLSQGPCCLTNAREGEGRGQFGQWRNGVKLTKTDGKSKLKTAVGRSWTLKLQDFLNDCSCLEWMWLAPEKLN